MEVGAVCTAVWLSDHRVFLKALRLKQKQLKVNYNILELGIPGW